MYTVNFSLTVNFLCLTEKTLGGFSVGKTLIERGALAQRVMVRRGSPRQITIQHY